MQEVQGGVEQLITCTHQEKDCPGGVVDTENWVGVRVFPFVALTTSNDGSEGRNITRCGGFQLE